MNPIFRLSDLARDVNQPAKKSFEGRERLSLGQQECQVFGAQVSNHAVLGADDRGGKVPIRDHRMTTTTSHSDGGRGLD
jgi:hypothetical protein